MAVSASTQEIVGALDGGVAKRDPDADGYGTRSVAGDVERETDRSLKAVGAAHGVAGVRDTFKHNRKLVASEARHQLIGDRGLARSARDGVDLAQGENQAVRDFGENPIGQGWSEIVIAVLEAVDID